MDILLDPFWACLLTPYEWIAWLFGWPDLSCHKRIKILEKSEEKLTDSLEITSLLAKINNTHAMLQFLMRGRHKDYMKFHESNILDIASCDSNSEHSGDDNKVSTDSSDSGADELL